MDLLLLLLETELVFDAPYLRPSTTPAPLCRNGLMLQALETLWTLVLLSQVFPHRWLQPTSQYNVPVLNVYRKRLSCIGAVPVPLRLYQGLACTLHQGLT